MMIIIGITGTLGAGKGTVVEYLINNKGFKHFSVSGYLNQELTRLGKELNRDNQRTLANEIRQKYGPDYITKMLFDEAQKTGSDSIIESIRNPKEAEFILGKGGFLLAVDANQEVRYERVKSRASEKDSVTFDEFKLQEEKEMTNTDPNSQNLKRCIEMANVVIHNDNSFDYLHTQIEQQLKNLKPSEKKDIKHKDIRPTWDEYFLDIMRTVSKRGTCDRGHASCVFVKDKQILVTGYAGAPAGFPHCDEVGHQIKKMIHEDGTITEHCVRTVHAEQNAICQAAKRGVPIDGATVYINMTPCRTCAMLLINCGVKRVVSEKKYHAGKESEEMFKKAKIKLEFIENEVVKYKKQ